MIHHQLGAAIASASTPAQLDDLARAVWTGFAGGQVSEQQAHQLSEAVEARRRALRRPEKGPAVLRVAVTREERQTAVREAPRPAPRPHHHGARQFVLRIPRPQTYDRSRSLERRRRLAASGPMPPRLAAQFTVGEQAVLAIVVTEVRERGHCDRSIGELAARSGTSDSTVKRAIRAAVKLGLITCEERRRPGKRNLANVIRIISREWLAWLERRGGAQSGYGNQNGSTGGQIRKPTDTLIFRRGLKGESWTSKSKIRDPHRQRGATGG